VCRVRERVDGAVNAPLYGRKYWVGAAAVVLALLAVAFLIDGGDVAAWRSDAGVVVGLVMWPFLVVYHVAWIRLIRGRSNSSSRR
jgi:hypothetical protein